MNDATLMSEVEGSDDDPHVFYRRERIDGRVRTRRVVKYDEAGVAIAKSGGILNDLEEPLPQQQK
jgi:hypothetical protein